MKILPQIQLCLLLLITLLEKAQQVTSNDNQTCNDQQYFEQTLGKCCSRCEPGNYVKNLCTETSDTECQPCEDGRYTSNWNYARRCINCKSCDPPLVEKEKCSRTKKQQCGCPDGYNCTQSSGMGLCLVCKPDVIPTTVPLPTEPIETRTTPTSSNNPPWVITVFIAVVLTVGSISLIFLIHRKKSKIMAKLGCMAKIKKPLPESSGLGFVVTSPTTQDNQKELSFPMEETDPLQSAEYAPWTPNTGTPTETQTSLLSAKPWLLQTPGQMELLLCTLKPPTCVYSKEELLQKKKKRHTQLCRQLNPPAKQ